ncbi:hypothetical protein [Mucilaginibacter sp. FT3.2]|uniref:hypothetical protein n=1 Tax=Mucilaginibacter sp. FT3.2 TaxID=2723090 RepID=UPI00161846B5|nr:hypothetical protein [Mucilaginibacter sp. FT3.2]MBB6231779.1 hypothetical protein [Mucilaginibacter sp. FT3.2]
MKIKIALLISLSLNTALFAQTKKIDPAQLKPFIPKGYTILERGQGDFNQDGYTDVILILASNKEEKDGQAARPLLILLGKADGSLSLYGRNDNVVLCKECGGVMGDPLQEIVVKGHYFSVEHYGGSIDRWSQVVTFKYDLLT